MDETGNSTLLTIAEEVIEKLSSAASTRNQGYDNGVFQLEHSSSNACVWTEIWGFLIVPTDPYKLNVLKNFNRHTRTYVWVKWIKKIDIFTS